MIDSVHLLRYVIRPVLMDLGLHSEAAERLVLGTACQESQCGRWLMQLGDVPKGGHGIYQMEPATHFDIWANFLKYHDDLYYKVRHWMTSDVEKHEELVGNLYYATVMCRIHYLRVPHPIPDTLPGQAIYWKTFYNTELGKGTVEEYINAWNRYVPLDLWPSPNYV